MADEDETAVDMTSFNFNYVNHLIVEIVESEKSNFNLEFETIVESGKL